jgi:type I restriction enzyme S subunit
MFNVPKLRFGEFEGEYKEVKVGDICNCIVPGRNKPKKFDGDIPWITTPDINSKYIFNPKECLFIDRDEAKKIGSKIIPKDSVVMSCVGELGVIAITKEPIVINQQLHAFLPSKVITSEFLNYSLLTQKKYMERVATKTTLLYMNKNSCNSIPILLPKLQEQKKISIYLTSIDKKIEQLNQKSTLLESYKKGVMQKIFSQEIRFKRDDGGVFEDWEEEKLKNYLIESRIKGSSGDKAKKITVKLWGQGVYAKNEIREGSSNTQYYIRKEGQLIYSKLDFLNCAFGLIPKKLDGYESTVDLPCFNFIKDVNKELLLERIKQKNFYKKNGDIADGSRKAKRIHANTFLSYTLFFPSLEEQQKISNFLTSIDQKITQNNQALEEMKAFKKGLLQQMFV